ASVQSKVWIEIQILNLRPVRKHGRAVALDCDLNGLASSLRSQTQLDAPRVSGRDEAGLKEAIAAIIQRCIYMNKPLVLAPLVRDLNAREPVNRVHGVDWPISLNKLLLNIRAGDFERQRHCHLRDLIQLK